MSTSANLQAIGTTVTCPSGPADASTSMPIAGAAPMTIDLHSGGAAGEPIVCAVSGATPVGLVPLAETGGPVALAPISSATPRIWGVVGSDISRVEIGVGDNHMTTVFVSGKPTGRQLAMGALGDYRAFAMPSPLSPDTFWISTFDAAGKQVFFSGYTHG